MAKEIFFTRERRKGAKKVVLVESTILVSRQVDLSERANNFSYLFLHLYELIRGNAMCVFSQM